MTERRTTLAELNAMAPADFAATLGEVFEHAAWVADTAAARRPFATVADLHSAMLDVVAGAPLALVEAAVWDDSGALLASNDGAGDATLFACGKGKARVDLGTRGRPGPYAVLSRVERWKDPAFTAHPLAASRMLGRAATGPQSLLEGTAGAVRHTVLDAAHQLVQTTSIAAGQCLRIAVGVEGEGTGLETRIFDAVTGEELDRSHGQNAAAVRACASGTTRSVRFEARATAGKLDAVIGERSSPSVR